MAKDNLTKLLGQLSVQSAQGESSNVQKTCVELLESGCSEPGTILKNLLVAIIQQDSYELGLHMLQRYKHIDTKYGSEFVLEKLYIFYKLNKLKEFEELYSVHGPKKTALNKDEHQTKPLRGILHVRAQFCYKNGFYDEAFRIYHYLATHNKESVDDELELACNVRAPLTATPELLFNLKLELPVPSEDHSSSYDLLFNDSMIQCSLGHYEKSLELLTRVYDLAKQEGNESDLDTIQLQLAYVQQLKGDKDESKKNLRDLLDRLAIDSPLKLLVKNNLKAFQDFSKYTTNLNLVLRELNVENFYTIEQNHFTRQQWSVLHNNFLFLHLFNNNSIKPKSSIVSRTLGNYRNLVEDVNLEPYSTQAKKAYHHAFAMINSTVEGSTVGFILLAIQLLVTEKKWDNAIRLGERFLNKCREANATTVMSDGKHHVICYILFALYSKLSRNRNRRSLVQLFEPKVLPRDFEFWKYVFFQCLECGDLESGEKILGKISSYIPEGDVISQVLADENLSVENSEKITRDVDVAAIIAAGTSPLETKCIKKNTYSNKIHKNRLLVRKKRRAQKVKKLLATRPESKSLDPERWIPLKDRTTYKPKKKQQAKQTQGGTANKKVEQGLDFSQKKSKNSKSSSKSKKRTRK